MQELPPSASSDEPPLMPQPSDQAALATERERFPAHFTFPQRYGYEPLPEQMKLEQISDDLRLNLWDSDEQGIRHSLLNQSSADVGLDEAIFMFRACACFAAYLTRKDQQRRQDP